MKIKRLYLEGYKRLALSGIQTIDWDTSQIYQVILGTNGSGKSSLIHELLPLPAHPNDYHSGGQKYIEIDYQKNEYVLISLISKKTRHLFYKNGMQLNEQENISYQRHLVYQEFGINDEIRSIMTGELAFTSMTPTKRRDIITQISDQDMTYAFNLYKQISTATRDQQGAIKHIRSRLTQEYDKLKNFDDVNIEKHTKYLQDELNALMEAKGNLLGQDSDLLNRLHELHSSFLRACEQIMQVDTSDIQKMSLKSYEQLSGLLYTLPESIERDKKDYEQHVKDFQRLDKLIGELSQNETDDPETLKVRINESIQTRDQHYKSIQLFHFDQDVSTMIGEIQYFKNEMVDVLSSLPDNNDRRYNRGAYEQVKKDIDTQRQYANGIEKRKQRLEQMIAKFESSTQVTCPKCSHEFKPGFCDKEYEQCVKERNETEKSLDEISKQIEKLQTFYSEIEEYLNQLSRLRRLQQNYPKAQNLIDYLFEDNRIQYSPSQHIQTVDIWIKDLEHYYEIQKLNRDIEIMERSLKELELLQKDSKDQIQHNAKTLEGEISNLSKSIREQKQYLEKLKDLKLKVDRKYSLAKQLKQVYIDLIETFEKYRSSLHDFYLDKAIRENQNHLAEQLEQLRQFQGTNSIIQSLESNLNELETDYEAYKLLTQALSPKEGVIADQILNFIGGLVEQINDIISGIYTYRLELLPCQIEINDLDYRFPVIIGEEQMQVNDISQVSCGQKEMIDLAFKLVALIHLGFEHFPLFLDEPGRHQDETHLAHMTEYLKSVIDSGYHDQLFMVQHYAVGHGAFNNANICVLDTSNISIPHKYNDQVTFS